jgi:hypothetical protein
MNQPGLNYLVAAVQFANGTSGVYSAIMDVDVFFGSKPEEDIMDFEMEMDEGTEYNILDKSEVENIQSDPRFQRAASNVICSELNDYGFQVCKQDRITSDTVTQQQPPSGSTDITLFFEGGDEDNESDEDEDEDNNQIKITNLSHISRNL